MIQKSYVGLSKDKTKKVYAILKSRDGYSEVIGVVTEKNEPQKIKQTGNI